MPSPNAVEPIMMICSTVTWKQTFQYDRFGNRRFDANNTTTLPANNGIYNPNIGADNKFLVSEGYNYDSEGNLTSNPESQLFQYDAENRQTQVTNSALNTSANYQYDGGGKRVRKLVGQEETIFVYDAFGKMIAEYSTKSANTPQISYFATNRTLRLHPRRLPQDYTGYQKDDESGLEYAQARYYNSGHGRFKRLCKNLRLATGV